MPMLIIMAEPHEVDASWKSWACVLLKPDGLYPTQPVTEGIVPNVNVMDDLDARIARLSDDEKRLFALICRSYLAAVMPDFEYRQTVATMKVPVPQQGTAADVEFRAVGRIPLVQGWKAAFGTAEPEPEGEEAEQTLPDLVDGQHATLTQPRVQAKQTQPPPRYSEGMLVDAMQNAWRFVKNEALRDRLKEAKGSARRPRAPRSLRVSNARTCWQPTASWSCRHRQACSCSSCSTVPLPRWSIPAPRQCGRCGSTM